MRKLRLIILLAFTTVITASAQGGTTRVRGVVKDAQTGEPLPFVGMYFEGTTIGITTDMQGRYSLETRSPDAKVLSAQLLGYVSASVPIHTGTFSEINFSLSPDPRQLDAALVKPDDRYIRSILAKLSDSLSGNDPDNGPSWSSRLYSKMELDITNADDLLKSGFLERNMGWLRNYQDTSAITGQSFIPAVISENISDVYHSQDPALDREVMRYSHISGFGKDEELLRQYTGAQFLRTNFHRRGIAVLNLDIPNPAASSSHLFYNYFLVDSLNVEGRKTYVLRFHPKKLVTSPTLDGEMHIDAEDFGIRDVHASLSPGSNVNWIRHMNVDIENRRTDEGRWFHGEEHLFIDFSISPGDSSKLLSFIGRRHLTYAEPEYGPVLDKDALTSKNTVVEKDVKTGDAQTWAQLRPYPLSAREQGIFDMVEEFQQTQFYKSSYTFLRTLIDGYYRVPGTVFELGRWQRTFSYDETEGFRVQIGGRTYHRFSEKLRLGGYVAYGFKDRRVKGEAYGEFMFRRDQTRKLYMRYRDDYVELASSGAFSAQNMITSLVARNHFHMVSRKRSFEARYEHEFNPSVNTALEWTTSRIWGNEIVPFQRPDGTMQESFSSNTLHAGIRLSKDERVTRSFYKKTYVYTKYPVVSLGVSGGIKGITPDDISYLRTDLYIVWKMTSNAIGFGELNINAGSIWGSVPYPLLKVHAGNQTYFTDKGAFSCMDHYEFLSDRWISGYYEHNFNGFFLGKIPLIKELDLREVATVRCAWGTLSDANGKNAPFLLPEGSGTLEKPYVELGVGISNILRILRVDCFWRVTHRRPEGEKNFTVNVGFDIDF